MRKFFFLFFLFPFTAFAQLDRVKVNMSESEFMKAVPEAQRDFDAEAGWVNDSAAQCGKLTGKGRWRIYRDTVAEYYFDTEFVSGPSAEYPKADSTGVHEMRESAEILRKKIELAHGKPLRFRNNPLTLRDPLSVGIVYLAEWEISDDQYMRICIRSPFEMDNQINAAPQRDFVEKKAESYEFYVIITAKSAFTRMQFDIGKTAKDFLTAHPAMEDQLSFAQYHIFTIQDTLTCENAEWTFTYLDNKLTYMEYDAYLGTEYLAKSDELAYDSGRKKALEIFRDAQKVHGKPDSLIQDVPAAYVRPENHMMFRKDYLYADWNEKSGQSVCDFTAHGGGKSRSVIFHVHYTFERAE